MTTTKPNPLCASNSITFIDFYYRYGHFSNLCVLIQQYNSATIYFLTSFDFANWFFLNMFMNVDESYRRQYKLPCCYSINWLFFFLNRDFSPVWIFLFQCLHWLLVNKLKMLYLCAGILWLYQTHIHTLMYNLYTYRNMANLYWDVRLRNNWYRVHDQTTCRFRKYIHFLTILDCMVSVSC